MTYPEPRFHAEAGEVSASFRPHTATPDLLMRTGGTQVSYLATSASTRGEFGLYRWDMGVLPSGPSAHFHRTISESFFVLSGRVRLFDGARWLDGTAGDFLHVPQGGVHAFRNESGEPASMLLLFAPGATREAYFEELARIATEGLEPTEQEWADLFRRHDQYSA